jgi:hypothetical protein
MPLGRGRRHQVEPGDTYVPQQRLVQVELSSHQQSSHDAPLSSATALHPVSTQRPRPPLVHDTVLPSPVQGSLPCAMQSLLKVGGGGGASGGCSWQHIMELSRLYTSHVALEPSPATTWMSPCVQGVAVRGFTNMAACAAQNCAPARCR